MIRNATGFGLYDRRVIEDIRSLNDPHAYFRGLICDLGYDRALIPFSHPTRKRGLTKNNFYTLWDLAMLGPASCFPCGVAGSTRMMRFAAGAGMGSREAPDGSAVIQCVALLRFCRCWSLFTFQVAAKLNRTMTLREVHQSALCRHRS